MLNSRHYDCLLLLAAFGEEFLGSCGLRCLDLAKQICHLVRCPGFAPQKRIERAHQEHLEADKLGENVHLHFAADGGCGAAE